MADLSSVREASASPPAAGDSGTGLCRMDETPASPAVRRGLFLPPAATPPQCSSLSKRGRPAERDGGSGAGATQQRFQECLHLCGRQGLPLDPLVAQQAVEVFRKVQGPLLLDAEGEGSAMAWVACVLYLVKRLGAPPAGAGGGGCGSSSSSSFTLSQLLRATGLSVADFFRELGHFLGAAGGAVAALFGGDCERRMQVREAHTNFVHLVVLFNYYKRVYQDYFLALDMEETQAAAAPGGPEAWRGSRFSIYMQFGWVLFLVLRARVLPRFADLVTCTNGLLAVVSIMVVHMPARLRKAACDDGSKFAVRAAGGGADVVASLCHLYHASERDVAEMVRSAGRMIQDVLFSKSCSTGPGENKEAAAAADSGWRQQQQMQGLPYFASLMEDDVAKVAQQMQVVEAEYEAWHARQGELDERAFIRGDDCLMGAMSLSSLSASGAKRRKFDVMDSRCVTTTGACPPASSTSPCASPVRANGGAAPAAAAAAGLGPCPSPNVATHSKMPPPTPVSTAMSTAKWFRTVIAPLPAEPSAELQQAFRACDHDVTDAIRSRVQVLTAAIFPGEHAGVSTWAQERRLEVTKLYYRVLEAMCRAEAARRHPGGGRGVNAGSGSSITAITANLTPLLSNDKFHRCMIACAAQLVLATHKTVTVTFAAVLAAAGVTAFDLSKVIEGFVRYEETLPRELKRHLNALEEELLESVAWEKGSSMYSSLVVAKAGLAPEIYRLSLLPDVEPAPAEHRPVSGDHTSPPRATNVSTIMTSVGELGISSSSSSPALSAFASPVKGRPHPPIHSHFASPRRPAGSLTGAGGPAGGGGQTTCAEVVIAVFFQKVLKLAAARVHSLCDRLRLPAHVTDTVVSTMRQLLHRGTSVFFNRHMDQLVLCCVYGVCKVSKVEVTFRDIISHYRKQPHCRSHVFRTVLIDDAAATAGGGDPHHHHEAAAGTGDVIRFYNQVFVPAAKGFLIPSTPTSAASPPPAAAAAAAGRSDAAATAETSAAPPAAPPAGAFASPKKVAAGHNVYVSPLRGPKMDRIMSPHQHRPPRVLSACVGESVHEFQSPSRDLSAINSRLNAASGGGSASRSSNSRRLDFGEVSLGLTLGLGRHGGSG